MTDFAFVQQVIQRKNMSKKFSKITPGLFRIFRLFFVCMFKIFFFCGMENQSVNWAPQKYILTLTQNSISKGKNLYHGKIKPRKQKIRNVSQKLKKLIKMIDKVFNFFFSTFSKRSFYLQKSRRDLEIKSTLAGVKYFLSLVQ